jgi:hypothetical protein
VGCKRLALLRMHGSRGGGLWELCTMRDGLSNIGRFNRGVAEPRNCLGRSIEKVSDSILKYTSNVKARIEPSAKECGRPIDA